ncbi:hypothetical protein LdCL_070006700 [Leishmania donovani]|uniref:Uncharacterized protein n=1 Tax=Leishmania donovani TaxID=5661 RepID=A0A3S7WPR1_LEIDO|nr:hypothetical protein LdCL_070006700 [Leishmania donovani]
MSALRRDRHSSTFSVNGSGTVPSPCHPSGHRTPTAFQPAPVRIFTVAVSEVPGEQLQSSGTAPSVANPVASPLDLAGGAATKSRLPVLLLAWMGEPESVVADTPQHLLSCARFCQCGRC